MLLKNPINRISALDALNHPFFNDFYDDQPLSLKSL